MDTLGFLLAAFGVVGLVIAGLRGLAHWAEHTARHIDDHPGTQQPTLATRLPDDGYLSEEEREEQTWYEHTTTRDLQRLDAIQHRLFQHPLNVVVENAIRQLLPPGERGWTRVHSGEYALVGVG